VTATIAPTLGPGTTPTPRPSSDRYALLEPCPDRPDCYIYVVRSGDNLQSIASYFGVPYARVLELNPSISDPALITKGDRIILPPPTR
jgi:spore germination protein YaaH